jgi:hypothetical protein
MVAIEAMACGTPAVITVHGGLVGRIDFGTQTLFADPHRPTEFGVMLAMPMLHSGLADELSVEGSRAALSKSLIAHKPASSTGHTPKLPVALQSRSCIIRWKDLLQE